MPRPPMGQTRAAPAASAPAASPPAAPVAVLLSRDEADLMVRTAESAVAFAHDYPLEFGAYCPPAEWEPVLRRAASAVTAAERQIAERRDPVSVPRDGLFAIIDLEECVSAAKDKRLDSTKLALVISAGGALAQVIGLGWLSLPAYLASLAVTFGEPVMRFLKLKEPEPQFQVGAPARAGGCGAAPSLGHHTDKARTIERVILPPSAPAPLRHYWGEAFPAWGPAEGAVCLSKGPFRVRVEGWTGDVVVPTPGWLRAPLSACESAENVVAVWTVCGGAPPRATAFGPAPSRSRHEESWWAEYAGPATAGACRRAGPFG